MGWTTSENHREFQLGLNMAVYRKTGMEPFRFLEQSYLPHFPLQWYFSFF
jgi:hypothetical protein